MLVGGLGGGMGSRKSHLRLVQGGEEGDLGPLYRLGLDGHFSGNSHRNWVILAVSKLALLGSILYFIFG